MSKVKTLEEIIEENIVVTPNQLRADLEALMLNEKMQTANMIINYTEMLFDGLVNEGKVKKEITDELITDLHIKFLAG